MEGIELKAKLEELLKAVSENYMRLLVVEGDTQVKLDALNQRDLIRDLLPLLQNADILIGGNVVVAGETISKSLHKILVAGLCDKRNTIPMIKLLRERTGFTLKAAKAVCDEISKSLTEYPRGEE